MRMTQVIRSAQALDTTLYLAWSPGGVPTRGFHAYCLYGVGGCLPSRLSVPMVSAQLQTLQCPLYLHRRPCGLAGRCLHSSGLQIRGHGGQGSAT
jgi:hypothetical protein